MKFITFAFLILGLNSAAQAYPLELDEVVRESIYNFFSEYRREVDLDTIQYDQAPQLKDDLWTIESSVWGEQGFTHKWGWFRCITKIQDNAASKNIGALKDLGSDCVYDFD